MPNPVLKQTLQMQEEQKRLEKEDRLKEEKSKKQNSKKVVFGSQLGVLELFEEIKIPNLDEFSRNPNKDEYPAVINGSLNPLTGRVEEFRDALINENLDILQDYQKFVFELIEIYDSGFVVDFPETPLMASIISNKRMNNIEDLLINTNLLQQSIDFITESMIFNPTKELQDELNKLVELSELYNDALSTVTENLDLYINHKGEKYEY